MPRFNASTLLLVTGIALTAAACDRSTTELIDEIDSAREGCTEEMLKASDEECVRMFERYAEMGEDALETYIGGMKALDEALRRRGGIQFDTTGLGRVFSEPLDSSASAGTLRVEPTNEPYVRGAPSWESPIEPSRSSRGEPQLYRPPTDAGPLESRDRLPDLEPRGGSWTDEPLRSGQPARRAPAPQRRGTLLPPEDRLRRPWIDDSDAEDAYLDGRDPADEPRSRERVDPFAGPPDPAPYRRE